MLSYIQRNWQMLVVFVLVAIGLRIACASPVVHGAAGLAADRHAEFVTGVMTALTNPITAGFFAAQMLGPLAQMGPGQAGLILSTTAALTFVKSLVVAAFISRPAVRRAVVRHFRTWARLVGVLFLCLAVQTLGPMIGPAFGR